MTINPDAGYVVYLRKSNGRKAVPRQKAIVSAYIDKRGGTVLRTFTDRDSTAYARYDAPRAERDDFDRMIEFLSSRTGLIVAAWHADRLLRGQEDTATLIRVCAANGHLIETSNGDRYDVSTASGRKRLRDDASDAEYEVDHLVERVTGQKDEAAGKGLWLGGRRPFGWEIWDEPCEQDGTPILDEDGNPARGYLLLHDTEADLLREAGAAILDGASVRSVVAQWNAAGVTSSTGTKWTQQELRRVLLRPRNAGLYVHRGQVTGNAQWPPVWDEHTHRRITRFLTDPARRTHATHGEVAHLLSGIARCGICGDTLICSTTTGKGGRRWVYRCRNEAKGGGAHVTRDADTLEAFVGAVVIERFRLDAKLLEVQKDSDVPALEKRKAAIEDDMRASNELRRQKLLTAAEFAEERAEHQAELSKVIEALQLADEDDVTAPMRRDPERVWETRTLDQQRAIIRAVMTVRVLPQGKGRPRGWRPGEPYFDTEKVKCEPVRSKAHKDS